MASENWRDVFSGRCLEEPAVIRERLGADASALRVQRGSGPAIELDKYGGIEEPRGASGNFGGMSLRELLDSGRDILAERVLSAGEPSYGRVAGLLPPVSKGAYSIIGSPAGGCALLVLADGSVAAQETARGEEPEPLFSPAGEYEEFGEAPARLHLLDGWMPVSVCVRRRDGLALETMCFVEPHDPDRDPLLWVRAVKYRLCDGEALLDECHAVRRSGGARRTRVGPQAFWDSFVSCVDFWKAYERGMCRFDMPEGRLSNCAKGAMASALLAFGGDHAHYGHRRYGLGIHDNFPPNYLTAIETFHAMGMGLRARRAAEHMLAHCVDEAGRFAYRQGDGEAFAASGAEYGQALWLLGRLEPALPPRGWVEPYLGVLVKMGRRLALSREESPEAGGARLIRMCAEADNNARVYAYASNNLWAARGLRALGDLLGRHGRAEAEGFLLEAQDLERHVRRALRAAAAESRYGPLPPFLFGYTAEPLTLSACRGTARPTGENELREYLVRSRDGLERSQDLTENTYANYRYYPEMLSSMLLEPEQADAVVRMREDIGGEFLGMSRFFGWVDDWPAANYARFLLATDRIDKYLLLLYSHTAHHGSPGSMVYYEQVSPDGAVVAPGCLPSMLLVPVMACWMFCFEPPGERALYLLRGIPRAWLEAGRSFGVDGLGCSFGEASIRVFASESAVEVQLRLPENADGRAVYLDLRLPGGVAAEDVEEGRNYVDCIERGYRLRLAESAAGELRITVRRRRG